MREEYNCMIKLNIQYIDEVFHRPLEALGKRYGFELDNECGIVLRSCLSDKKRLRVSVEENQAHIEYNTKSDFFRGIGYIIQKMQQDEVPFNLVENKYFSFNGLMIDCSRNGVIHVEYAKEVIERLAIMGHSVLMLYMEDVYTLSDEPYFGYMRGRYTKEELRAIDQYALQFGIEVIPCIQTLAHLEQFLAWDSAKEKYLDIANIMCVGKEEVIQLIDKMIKELSEIFTSKRIHVGMDEAHNLGRGRYADKNGLQPKNQIMKRHLEDVLRICQTYKVHPIIWDDMFFSNYGGNGLTKDTIPEAVNLMYWDYYNNTQDKYEENLMKRKKIKREVMFAGGAWRWIGYAPHHSKTYVTTTAALMACKKAGVEEVIVTAWGDDGSEAPMSTSFFGTVLFAEHGYNEEVDIEHFKERLKFCTGISYEHFMKQEEFDILPEVECCEATVTPSKYMFYEDPLCSMFTYHTKEIKQDLTKHYEELEQYFKQAALGETNLQYKAIDEVYENFAKVLGMKWNLGINLLEAYKQQDKDKLKHIIQNQIEPLIIEFEVFGEKRFKEWQMTSKSFGYDALDIRIGGIIQRLKRTKNVVNDYIDGKIDRIFELEEVRLPKTPYREKGAGEMIQYNEAQKIMTASKMCW